MKNKYIFPIAIIFLMFFATVDSAYASGLTWTENKSFSRTNYRDAVCSDNGLYLAVGDAGLIKTSDDLTNWVIRESGTNEYLYGCTYGNGVYVAVGANGTVLYSRNGADWHAAKVEDGIDFEDVVWGNGRFVAVGCIYPLRGLDDKRYILTSEDGINWRISFESAGKFGLSGIKYVNKTFIAVGWHEIAYSTDGENWSFKDLGEDKNFNDIIYDGSRYIGIGSKSDIYTSSDPTAWNRLDNNFNGAYFLQKIEFYKNSYYLVISNGGVNFLFTSKDLSNWSIANESYYPEISCLISNEDKLVAIGWSALVLQTADGIKWDASVRFGSNFTCIEYNGDSFLALSSEGDAFISKDGLEWKKYGTSMSRIPVDVVWDGERFIALGVSYGTGDEEYNIVETEVYESKEGINWTSKGTLGRKNIERIFYLNDLYYAIGREGEILSSKDAVNWIAADTGTDSWLRGMAWNGKQYVCVGMFGTILTSIDGQTWSAQNARTLNDLNSVIWNGSCFVAAGGFKTVTVSADGVKWEARAEYDSTSFEDIVWNGKEFFLLANTGETYVSEDLKSWTKGSATNRGISNGVAWNGYRYVVITNSGVFAEAVPDSLVKVVVDGKPVVFDVAPINRNGRNLVPLRAIFNSLGAEVKWDAATRTITGVKDDTTIVLQLGSDKAFVNGEEKILDSPAISFKGRTMVPARFIAESLGAVVEWDAETRTVYITTK